MAFDTMSPVIPASGVNSDGVGVFLQTMPSATSAPSVDLATVCGAHHPNALIAPRALTMLLSQLTRPIALWDPARSADLPPHSAGTLVISHVETLNARQQQALLDFLDDQRDAVQIISVAATELFQCVERGEFSEALFYRLNTIRIDAVASLHESPSAACHNAHRSQSIAEARTQFTRVVTSQWRSLKRRYRWQRVTRAGRA